MTKKNNAKQLEQSFGALKPWRAALYIRLSKEDGDKQESYSITSQREILLEYLKQHPEIELFDIYIDDGWSGTNFDRPSFTKMMNDINFGNVNCVIVKDLSRFGRNYTDAGYYIDNVFVRLKVRFISLNNSVDTASNSMNAATQCITVGVQNVINESVAATTSVNVRGTLNVSRKQGKFIGSFPTYGYLKDPLDRHKLIVDNEVAPVVQMIFRLFIGGKSVIGVTKELNRLGIPNPTAYKKSKGWNYQHTSSKNNDGLWCDSTVRRILTNEMYIGNMVQGKNTTVSYKIKQCRAVPKDEWIIVENTHEAIIDKESFDTVQVLFKRNTRTTAKKGELDLFAGFVKCADCKRAMSKKTNKFDYGTYSYYRCVTTSKIDSSACSPHSIRIDKLEHTVLTTIQAMIDTALELDKVVDEIDLRLISSTKKSTFHTTMGNYISQCEKQKGLLVSLYPDWKSGIITKDEYLLLKQNINKKISSLENKIETLQNEVENTQDNAKQNEFITNFKKYGKIEKLTRTILTQLVDTIYVHDNGSITINFKFKDAYEQLVEYIEKADKELLEETA